MKKSTVEITRKFLSQPKGQHRLLEVEGEWLSNGHWLIKADRARTIYRITKELDDCRGQDIVTADHSPVIDTGLSVGKAAALHCARPQGYVWASRAYFDVLIKAFPFALGDPRDNMRPVLFFDTADHDEPMAVLMPMRMPDNALNFLRGDHNER